MQASIAPIPGDNTTTQLGRRMALPLTRSNETTYDEGDLDFRPVGRFPSDTIGELFACGPTLGDFGTNNDIKKQVFAWLIGTRFYKTHSTLGSANPYSPAFDAAISKIEEFRSRRDGWKGPDSLGPLECTIKDAKTFAAVVLADDKVEPPHIGLAADGEILFFWHNPQITIDLTIAGDGTYAYFAKLNSGQPFFEDAAPVTQNLPEEILDLIRRKG